MVLASYSSRGFLDDTGRVSLRCDAMRLFSSGTIWQLTPYSYLILPGLYAKDAQLRFTEAVLSVFVVALLTAGYSFTALLCFACRNDRFQADGVFL